MALVILSATDGERVAERHLRHLADCLRVLTTRQRSRAVDLARRQSSISRRESGGRQERDGEADAVWPAPRRGVRSRDPAVTDARMAADIESSVELLRTIAAVLDIRDVFPRVSAIAARMVPHDLLTMMFHDRGGQILIEAASTDEFRGLSRFTKTDDSEPPEGFIIVDDFTAAELPVIEPLDLRERILAAGFRSLLVVLTKAGHQSMGLAFWSKSSRTFSRDDVPVARRVADHVALAVSHQQLAEAARHVAQ